jgi:uncharacterized protein
MKKESDLIGRLEEKKILESALHSSKPEMVSVIGRRRVGKTFLIKSVYERHIDFEITGIQHASRAEQLRNFMIQMGKYAQGSGFPVVMPKDWLEAFYLLSTWLETRSRKGKQVVFLDELPWLATHRSGFLKGLSWFWNSWAVNRDIVVVVCGSAASWMIQNIVHNKGGLHNRITRRIYLKPFNLEETEKFLQSKKLHFDRYQILQLYMTLGGVPHYLDELEGGKSVAQNIDAICFAENGLLRDEFSKLYAALFDNAALHVKIVRTLATKNKGLTRLELVQNGQLSEGGGLTDALEELLHSGFISVYQPFDKKKKESLYRLTDEFSLFYLQFMEPHTSDGAGTWQKLSKKQTYITWSGYAFENICLKHIEQIKKALGISGIYAVASSYFRKSSAEQEGFQIDLLIDRDDHVINMCEIKFYAAELVIDKNAALRYRNKIMAFKTDSKTNKQVMLTFITTFGVQRSDIVLSLTDSFLTMEQLFE